ncbi:hypothetical protein BGX29_009680 [Mortierella sp. GBA35]|nr:hypothetical protein BGX29_009680 [Mortierella sp. GBA35]
MPLLIQAVPLTKTWLGGHYWRTPTLDILSEELEYLPKEEIKQRFDKLNLIAKRTYPTIWPNISVILFFIGLATAAGYALSKIGSSNLAIMGQGICFILPIILVVWVKVRKETKARARRRFKHQSQRVLRTWTAQDTQSHAMQWKIRLRPKSTAAPWLQQSSRRRRSSSGQTDTYSQRRQQPQEQEQDQLQDHHHHLLQQEQEQQQQFHAGTTVISMTDALQLDHHQTHDENEGSDIATLHRVSWVDPRIRREHDRQQHRQSAQEQDHSNYTERPPSFIHHTSAEPSAISPPSPIVSLFETIRVRAQRRRAATFDSAITTGGPQQDPADIPTTAATAATHISNISPATSSILGTTGDSPNSNRSGTSIWSTFRDYLGSSFCCGLLFREPKVWLIEISLRECQLDEYALMVPSPVYCDYRLPGYDDIMAGVATGAGNGIDMTAAASSSRTGLNRYTGLPPAYESESESEGEDDDDDEDDDLEDDHLTEQVQEQVGCRLTHLAAALQQDNGPSGSSAGDSGSSDQPSQPRPQMEMIQRPVEMTSIVVMSSADGSTGTPSFPLAASSGSSDSQEYTQHHHQSTSSTISLPSIVESKQ